ncbi:prepilin-type N-terminal cleavage/methylation domain-containing protein [Marinobacterium jannaschii]|uniref:prepilin-type N-terminal cleavage/methylation domain-containing protein n=1 Tax=Marinobacterium jannaschii TaxID=64970 RepID=UPI0004894DEE|nr:prepilin-type N-terminal cleavage/methylation domain-containing protein [Marinobacterium jannaschii]
MTLNGERFAGCARLQSGYSLPEISIGLVVASILALAGQRALEHSRETQHYEKLGNRVAQYNTAVAKWTVDQGATVIPNTYTGVDWLKDAPGCGLPSGGTVEYLPCGFTFTDLKYGGDPTTVVTNAAGVTAANTTWPQITVAGEAQVLGPAYTVAKAQQSTTEAMNAVTTYADDSNGTLLANVAFNAATGVFLPRNGSLPMTGNLDMGGFSVINADTGNFTGAVSAGSLSTSGSLSAGSASIAGAVSAASASFTGNISTGSLNATGGVSAASVTATTATVSDTASIDKLQGNLQITNVVTSGAACTSTGSLAVDATGALLSCVSGSWAVPGGGGAGDEAGQIAAFTSGCPSGWSEYRSARGRVLIGTGRYSESYANGRRRNFVYRPGDRGGEAFHQLTEAELASHSHGSSNAQVPYGRPNPGLHPGSAYIRSFSDSVYSGNLSAPVTIGSSGSDIEHENRMPYVAVSWCQKS